MNPLILLDTETTGLDNPALVDLAYLIDGHLTSLRCKPRKEIELGAMMVNHITNKMVAPLLSFKAMPAYTEIKDILESGIVVAHHAIYDVGVLENEGIDVHQYVCTKEIAQKLYPQAAMHKLQYLRYFLDLDVEGEAHSANGDVAVLKALWQRECKDGGGAKKLIAEFLRTR